jgi:hypothetical protein
MTGARPRLQAEERDRITGHHDSGQLRLFCGIRHAGLVLPLSSFFLTLLEYYGLQLQHLSPNSIALVATFIHLCEMYVGVRPSVRQFRRFFVLKAVSQRPPLIGGYYFQRPLPLAGGSDGEKIGHWCRRTFTAGSHFPLAVRPSIALSGGKTPVWS